MARIDKVGDSTRHIGGIAFAAEVLEATATDEERCTRSPFCIVRVPTVGTHDELAPHPGPVARLSGSGALVSPHETFRPDQAGNNRSRVPVS